MKNLLLSLKAAFAYMDWRCEKCHTPLNYKGDCPNCN